MVKSVNVGETSMRALCIVLGHVDMVENELFRWRYVLKQGDWLKDLLSTQRRQCFP